MALLGPPGDLNKEAVRSLQGEDKDEDSSDPTPVISHPDDTSVDLRAVRRAFTALWTLPGTINLQLIQIYYEKRRKK